MTIKIETKNQGVLCSCLKSNSGTILIRSLEGIDDFSWKTSCPWPVMIFPQDYSTIKVQRKNKSWQLSSYNFLVLPGGIDINISQLSAQSKFTVFYVTNQALALFEDIYNLSSKDLFTKEQTYPISTWIHQIFHRLTFAKTIEKNPKTGAESFLEIEIVKELYYTHQRLKTPQKSELVPMDQFTLEGKHPKIEEAVIFIENHLFEKIHIDMLVSLTGCSKSTLNRMFKKIFSKSTGQFIRDRRMEQAHLMIRTSNYSVAEIADIIGQKNTSTFIRLFKKKFKQTPFEVVREYRNRSI